MSKAAEDLSKALETNITPSEEGYGLHMTRRRAMQVQIDEALKAWLRANPEAVKLLNDMEKAFPGKVWIYGGFIRAVLSGVAPSDLDVVVDNDAYSLFGPNKSSQRFNKVSLATGGVQHRTDDLTPRDLPTSSTVLVKFKTAKSGVDIWQLNETWQGLDTIPMAKTIDDLFARTDVNVNCAVFNYGSRELVTSPAFDATLKENEPTFRYTYITRTFGPGPDVPDEPGEAVAPELVASKLTENHFRPGAELAFVLPRLTNPDKLRAKLQRILAQTGLKPSREVQEFIDGK